MTFSRPIHSKILHVNG